MMFANAVWAQDGKWELGLVTGVGFSNISDIGSARFNKTNSRTGIVAGLTSNYQFAKHWRISAGAQYLRKGVRGLLKTGPQDPGSGSNYYAYNTNFILDYLTLPAAVQFVSGTNLKWHIDGGVYGGYLLKGATGLADQLSVVERRKRRYNDFDCGVVAGAGLDYPIAKQTRIGIGYELQHGFTDVFKNAPTGSGPHKNTSHQILIGIKRSL